jgi:hypothetical protein
MSGNSLCQPSSHQAGKCTRSNEPVFRRVASLSIVWFRAVGGRILACGGPKKYVRFILRRAQELCSEPTLAVGSGARLKLNTTGSV